MQTSPLEKIEALAAKGRECRNFVNFELRAKGGDGQEEYIVEGVAVTFNQPTVMWTSDDGTEYKEQIDDRAFDDADMSDVIFNYNHGGKVVARTRNKTLQLFVKKDGLHMRADLSGTEEGRRLYEEIAGGYIDKMSYLYTVSEDAYDVGNRMRTIRKIRKLYDVSAVDIPVYDTTSISARSVLALDKVEREKLESEIERRRKLLLLTEL